MTGIVLGPKALSEIRQVVRRVLQTEIGSSYRRPKTPQSQINTYVMKSTSAITAATTADVAGSGSAKIHYKSTNGTLTDTSQTFTIYNYSTSSVASGSFLTAVQDVFGTLWVQQGGSGGAGLGILIAKPDTTHTSDDTETYSIQKLTTAGAITATTVNQVAYQKSGYSYDSSNLHLLFETTGGGYYSIPIEYQDCEVGDLNVGTKSALTLTTDGEITRTGTYHRVDTNTTTMTSDDLETVNGGAEGDILVLSAQNATRTVVAKDGTGNLRLNGDFSMDNTQDTLFLIHSGSNWLEISRSNNAA